MSNKSVLPPNVISTITGACSHLYQFRLPKTKPVDYSVYFNVYLSNVSTNEFITSLTQKRNALMYELFGTSISNGDVILLAVDEYLKLLHKLMYSLSQQQAVDINGPMVFEWNGPISANEDYYKSNDLMYELIMVMYAKAIVHSMIGSYYSLQAPTITNAAQQFILSANVMENIYSNLLPKWTVRSPNTKQTPLIELQENTCMMLASYFKSSAQQLTICKALIKEGGTAFTLLSKLCLGIKYETESAINKVKSVVGYNEKFNVDFLIHLRYQLDLFSSLSYYFFGHACFDDSNIGKSICCYNIAYSLLQEQTSKKFEFQSNGFPKLLGKLQHIATLVNSLRNIIIASKQSNERENNVVYFQNVPKEILPNELPVGTLVLKTSPFVFPNDESIILFVKEAPKPGVMGAIMSAFTYNSSTTKLQPPSAPLEYQPTTRPRSDSDIAREFQRKINSGEII